MDFRIAWLLLIISGSLGIIQQIIMSWNALSGGPVQVVVRNPHSDLHNVDFPAVTICSFNKVNAVRANVVFER